jgi:hypothetical protein
LGILSSDCVLRLFDLSSNLEIPEQEYHLQPATLHNLMSAVAIRPVAFAFGGEHLWDRFTVFVLFSNCSVYALCPVVPFGSIYNSSTIEEIYKDAYVLGLQSNSVGSKAALYRAVPVILASHRVQVGSKMLHLRNQRFWVRSPVESFYISNRST